MAFRVLTCFIARALATPLDMVNGLISMLIFSLAIAFCLLVGGVGAGSFSLKRCRILFDLVVVVVVSVYAPQYRAPRRIIQQDCFVVFYGQNFAQVKVIVLWVGGVTQSHEIVHFDFSFPLLAVLCYW